MGVCARNSPKEAGNFHKFSEVEMRGSEHEWECFPVGNNNSLLPSGYVKHIP